MIALCHIHIREAAKAAAGHLYERLIGDKRFYEAWKRENPDAGPQELEWRFVERNWGKCIPFVREALTEMLKRSDLPGATKAQIIDVLAKDQSLIRGRARG